MPELIDARTGDVTWQQSFDTDITDVFEVQSQIAARVAGALGVALGGKRAAAIDEASHRQRRSVSALSQGARHHRARPGEPSRLGGVPGAGGGTRLDLRGGLGQPVDCDEPASTPMVSPVPRRRRRAKEALDRAASLQPGCAAESPGGGEVPHADHPQRRTSRPARWTWRCGQRRTMRRCSRRRASTTCRKVTSARRWPSSSGPGRSTRGRTTTLYNLGPGVRRARVASRMREAARPCGTCRPARRPERHSVGCDDAGSPKATWQAARAGLRAAIASGVTAPTLAAQFAGFQENTWILDPDVKALVFRLTPSAFDNDRASGASRSAPLSGRAGIWRGRGPMPTPSIPLSKSQADGAPNDPQLRVLYGLVLAYRGKAAEARAAADLALNAGGQAHRAARLHPAERRPNRACAGQQGTRRWTTSRRFARWADT